MWNPFRAKYSTQEKNTISFLKEMLIFSQLSDEEMYVFLPNLYLRTYTKDEVIFFRNDPSQALYIIRRGQVRLEIDIDERFEDIAHLKVGDFFGENSLIKSSHRLYNATSTEEGTQLYILPLANASEIFEDYPRIKSSVYEMLSQHQHEHILNLFNAYRESYGFFELGKSYFSKP